MKYTYLLINLCSLLVPLIFSFHPKIRLYKSWYALIPAILICGLFYCLWDSWFAHLGVWGFNPAYITGIYLGNLPLEEILFFVCIPYACVFTFECISPIISQAFLQKRATVVNYGLVIALLVFALIFRARPYTLSAFSLLALMVLLAAIKKTWWLPKFYLVYCVLLIPFIIVNGLLTGTGLANPIIWYSPSGIMGPRILTIPVEDVFYGMGLIMANVWIYQWLKLQWRPRPHLVD